MASDLPFCDIFVPQKVPLAKISDDVIEFDLWFATSLPNQKAWLRLWRDLFFLSVTLSLINYIKGASCINQDIVCSSSDRIPSSPFGGRCLVQWLMMWSMVSSSAPLGHAAESRKPHRVKRTWHLPAPVRRRFKVTNAFLAFFAN